MSEEVLNTTVCEYTKCQKVSDCPFVRDFERTKELYSNPYKRAALVYIEEKAKAKNCLRVEELKI